MPLCGSRRGNEREGRTLAERFFHWAPPAKAGNERRSQNGGEDVSRGEGLRVD